MVAEADKSCHAAADPALFVLSGSETCGMSKKKYTSNTALHVRTVLSGVLQNLLQLVDLVIALVRFCQTILWGQFLHVQTHRLTVHGATGLPFATGKARLATEANEVSLRHASAFLVL